MILHPQNASILYRMKKKSSDSSWAAWVSILAVAIAAAAAFGASEVLMMHSRTVKFINIRAPTLMDVRVKPSAQDVVFKKSTPLLYFMTDRVVFGSISSVISPKKSQDILFLDKENWQKDLEEKINLIPNLKILFPSKIVAYCFENNEFTASFLTKISAAGVIFKNINKKSKDHNATLPVPIFIKIPEGT